MPFWREDTVKTCLGNTSHWPKVVGLIEIIESRNKTAVFCHIAKNKQIFLSSPSLHCNYRKPTDLGAHISAQSKANEDGGKIN